MADGGGTLEPAQAWRMWNPDPVLLVSLSGVWWLYGRGLRQLWASGAGRSVARWQPPVFLGGLLVLVMALVSPLDALSGQLASAHMVQHMLLMVVAAPLVVLGGAPRVASIGLPRPWRRRAVRCGKLFVVRGRDLLRDPLAVWLLQAVVVWVWHFPALYEAALRSPLVHDAQHLSFFGSACLDWRAVVDSLRSRRLQPVGAVISLFATSIHSSALGVLLALAPRVVYADFLDSAPAWGLTPLEDQQLAGLIMWMPACLVYAVAAAAIFGAWLGNETARTERFQRNPVRPEHRSENGLPSPARYAMLIEKDDVAGEGLGVRENGALSYPAPHPGPLPR